MVATFDCGTTFDCGATFDGGTTFDEQETSICLCRGGISVVIVSKVSHCLWTE
ncbi:hypothetical protein DEO72_LG10g2532 [Vigna unguiculata]|uniref:Uncharacterized protein n=1 Tax=Vigna unguiculata TaxID=3917 RepID=A0A4D6NFI6_VIGUN|nr:hypothetical protein DEO72_LG10g2532 [Vigna unguiculata]